MTSDKQQSGFLGIPCYLFQKNFYAMREENFATKLPIVLILPAVLSYLQGKKMPF